MKSALVNLVIGLGQALNAYYAAPDRETIELISAITRWLDATYRRSVACARDGKQ